jgi:uncharacterized membrane protein YdjX (TVP38/TMEM64 family)
MNGNWGRLVALCLFIGIIISMRISPIGQLFSFENFIEHRSHLQAAVAGNYFLAIITYVAIYMALSALSFPGAGIITMAGGFLFGTGLGTLLADIGATSGGCIAFLISRYLIGKPLQERYKEKFAKFNKEFEESGAAYLFTMRLIAVLPFFIANILASMTRVSIKTFAWTTALGIIPGSFVYAYTGAQLNYISSPKDAFSTHVILAFIALILLSVTPIIFRKMRSHK